jgi:hypothetical protein
MPDTTSLPPTGPRTHRLRHLNKRSLAALVCLFVLVIALPLGMLTWQTQHSYRSNLSPAQQTSATATARSQIQAEATLAAQARVQATAGITGSIGAGKILYKNALNTRGGGWIDDGTQCFFRPQGYHVQTINAHEFAWCYTGQQAFSNVVISVQARLIRGDIYGLVFRLSPASQRFYTLEINNRGDYRFVLATGGNPNAWITLIDWTHTNALLTGQKQSNSFMVIAAGSNFRFYINKQLIITSYTNTAYASGMVGFLVGGDTRQGTEAVFSNIFIFQK